MTDGRYLQVHGESRGRCPAALLNARPNCRRRLFCPLGTRDDERDGKRAQDSDVRGFDASRPDSAAGDGNDGAHERVTVAAE